MRSQSFQLDILKKNKRTKTIFSTRKHDRKAQKEVEHLKRQQGLKNIMAVGSTKATLETDRRLQVT